MKIKSPDCARCMHRDVCSQNMDVDIFCNDISQMTYLNEKTYEQKRSIFEIHIICKHFMNEREYVKADTVTQ